MRRLLLISTSTVHGTGYLDHAAEEITHHLQGIHEVLFVPYALHDRDRYTANASDRFARLGLALESIHVAEDPVAAVRQAEALFIGGGNTFVLLDELYTNGLIEPIREKALAGMPYIGTSAGSNVACASIKTTNDMPIVYPPSFDALGLVPFNVNPHYLDPDPSSTHMGETRELRIRQFHERNDPPVVGLREGSMLHVEGDTVELLGSLDARLFRKGRRPVEFAPRARLDFLLE